MTACATGFDERLGSSSPRLFFLVVCLAILSLARPVQGNPLKPPAAFRCLSNRDCTKYFQAADTYIKLDDIKTAHGALYQAMGVCASAKPMPEYHCDDQDLIFYYAIFLHRKAQEYSKAIDIYKRAAILYDASNKYARSEIPSVLNVIRDHIKEVELLLHPPARESSPSPPAMPSQPSPAKGHPPAPVVHCELKNVTIHIEGDGVNFCGYSAPDIAIRKRRSGIIILSTMLGFTLAVAAGGVAAVIDAHERSRNTAAPPGTHDPLWVGLRF